MDVVRGDIFWVKFGQIPTEPVPSEILGTRPAIIVSVNSINVNLAIAVPLTSNTQLSNTSVHVYIMKQFGLEHHSVALCEQLRVVNKLALGSKIGNVDNKTMRRIEQGMIRALGLFLPMPIEKRKEDQHA